MAFSPHAPPCFPSLVKSTHAPRRLLFPPALLDSLLGFSSARLQPGGATSLLETSSRTRVRSHPSRTEAGDGGCETIDNCFVCMNTPGCIFASPKGCTSEDPSYAALKLSSCPDANAENSEILYLKPFASRLLFVAVCFCRCVPNEMGLHFRLTLLFLVFWLSFAHVVYARGARNVEISDFRDDAATAIRQVA